MPDEIATFFDDALDTVLENEGGLVTTAAADAVGDPGGETNCGITAVTLRGLGIDKAPSDLTHDEVRQIYFAHYWAIPGGPRNIVPASPALALAVFDTGVHQGMRTAIKMLQRTLGVTDDGIVGRKTQNAIWGREASTLILFHQLRRSKLCAWVAAQPEKRGALLRGLVRRVDRMERICLLEIIDGGSQRMIGDVFSGSDLLYGPE